MYPCQGIQRKRGIREPKSEKLQAGGSRGRRTRGRKGTGRTFGAKVEAIRAETFGFGRIRAREKRGSAASKLK